MTDLREQWVLFSLDERRFGIPIPSVLEMVVLERVTPIPLAPRHVRGVINLRGGIITVLDLRERLALPRGDAAVAATIALLEEREQDHVRWLEELEGALREGRAFRLTTDPHACAFGRWYDAYQTDDIMLSLQLLKFDLPHRRIHALADVVLGLAANGALGEALAAIAEARASVLAEMRGLFAETRRLLRASLLEVVIIVDVGGRRFGLAVDRVTETCSIPPEAISVREVSLGDAAVQRGIALVAGAPVQLLEPAALVAAPP